MNESAYRQLLSKARDAQIGGVDAWRLLSTGEKVAVALVLDHADWLAIIDYTLAEALERTGTDWLRIIPRVARTLEDEQR